MGPTIGDPATPDTRDGARAPSTAVANGPGSGRLRLGGFLLAAMSLLLAWSLGLAALGVRALDFTWFGVRVASHPGAFVLDDVSLPLPAALGIVLPLALLGVAAGGRLWSGGSPRPALAASLLWIALAVGIALGGGGLDLLAWQGALAALLVSGAWARRATTPWSTVGSAAAPRPSSLDTFDRGE